MSGHDDILIGLDAGTSLVKCVAFNADGAVLSVASSPNEYVTTGDDCVEQDMLVTRANVLDTLAELVNDLGKDSGRIKAVSVTGQGDGMWLADSAGEPVHNALLWLDSRSADIASDIASSHQYQRLFELTGTAVNASQMRTQMLWYERNEPALLDRAASSFHCKDYLYSVLTGERACDPGEAVFTFGDFRTRCYSEEVLALLGLLHRAELLPPIVDGLSQAAALLPSIAERTGLPSSTFVTLAPVDVVCSALGGGLYDRGIADTAITLLGTTGIHMRYSNTGAQLTLPEDKTGYTILFPGGGYAQLQTNMSATMNIDWLLSLISQTNELVGHHTDKQRMLEILDEQIACAGATSVVYYPYISTAGERGPFFDANARAGFVGLDQNTGLIDLARSVYEGICLAARDCYDDLGELPEEIRVSGGGARSSSLKQILASVLNRPVRSVEREEAGAAGAAMIAAVQLGYFDSLDNCVRQWVSPFVGTAVQPDPADTAGYQKMFSLYKTYRKHQSPVWQQLAAIRHHAGSKIS